MTSFLYIIKAEWLRLTSDYKFYKANYIFTHINFFLLLSGLFAMQASKSILPNDTLQFIFHITIWYLSFGAVQSFAAYLTEEQQSGSLYQLIMSRSSLLQIFLVRQVLQSIISLFFIAAVFSLLIIVFDLPLALYHIVPVIGKFFLLLIINFIAVYGIAFIIGSFTFKYRRIMSAANIVNYIFLFFTGGLVPLENLPRVLQIFAKIIPLSQANQIFQNKVEHVTSSFVVFFIWSLALFFYGIYFFKKSLNKSIL